ncbi:cyclic-amp response element binding protein [Anaeramoeba flamelloides]|uniref:Cyclic-amp response element binding protein n=1 Tax=Anaeramoeba flamelloides TaxID=1746091 RepID=A0AAV7ZZ35_9EUKA|nr:cyclic-amp response element binding protein [Anaeramoeba flamelloides]
MDLSYLNLPDLSSVLESNLEMDLNLSLTNTANQGSFLKQEMNEGSNAFSGIVESQNLRNSTHYMNNVSQDLYDNSEILPVSSPTSGSEMDLYENQQQNGFETKKKTQKNIQIEIKKEGYSNLTDLSNQQVEPLPNKRRRKGPIIIYKKKKKKKKKKPATRKKQQPKVANNLNKGKKIRMEENPQSSNNGAFQTNQNGKQKEQENEEQKKQNSEYLKLMTRQQITLSEEAIEKRQELLKIKSVKQVRKMPEEEKRLRRMEKNRVSARRTRERKKAYWTNLEQSLKLLTKENESLRQENERFRSALNDKDQQILQLHQLLGEYQQGNTRSNSNSNSNININTNMNFHTNSNFDSNTEKKKKKTDQNKLFDFFSNLTSISVSEEFENDENNLSLLDNIDQDNHLESSFLKNNQDFSISNQNNNNDINIHNGNFDKNRKRRLMSDPNLNPKKIFGGSLLIILLLFGIFFNFQIWPFSNSDSSKNSNSMINIVPLSVPAFSKMGNNKQKHIELVSADDEVNDRCDFNDDGNNFSQESTFSDEYSSCSNQKKEKRKNKKQSAIKNPIPKKLIDAPPYINHYCTQILVEYNTNCQEYVDPIAWKEYCDQQITRDAKVNYLDYSESESESENDLDTENEETHCSGNENVN